MRHEQFRAQKIQDAQTAARHANEDLRSVNSRFIEQRGRFFDTLAVLDGGAIVASTTLLAYFAPSIRSVHLRLVLESAWIILLFAMAAALARNFSASPYVWYAAQANYTRRKAEVERAEVEFYSSKPRLVLDRYSGERIDPDEQIKIHESNAKVWDSETKKGESKEKIFERCTKIFQYTSLILSLCGIILLVVFALANIR
jgi:hypothetical protein